MASQLESEPAAAATNAFAVTLSGSGHEFSCASDEAVLTAGLNAGYMLPYNCRSGFCRTCKSRILSGEVVYPVEVKSHYLSLAEREEGLALLCQAHAVSDLVVETDEIVGVAHIAPRRSPCKIVALEALAPDVLRVTLRFPMNENLRYFPGQHLSIELSDGARREYSIASACAPQGMTLLDLHIRHLPGGLFTDKLFAERKIGALLRVDVPLGTFLLKPGTTNPLLLIATGTGFAPLKAMIEQEADAGRIQGRTIHLYWGGRRREDLYMMELAERWAAEHPSLRFVPVLSQPSKACAWDGATGYVQDRVLADLPDLSALEVYACGSPAMVAAARARFEALGSRAPIYFHSDEFLTAADRAAAVASPA